MGRSPDYRYTRYPTFVAEQGSAGQVLATSRCFLNASCSLCREYLSDQRDVVGPACTLDNEGQISAANQSFDGSTACQAPSPRVVRLMAHRKTQ